MTCKNCIYEPMCHNVIAYGMDTDDVTATLITDIEKHCKHFKDKSRVIVPPCKVGDTVYYAGIDTPVEFTVIGFSKGRMYGCSVADYEEFVEDNELNVDEWYVHLDSFCGLRQMSPLSSFGKRLFVGVDAEKEAEKALAEREGKG